MLGGSTQILNMFDVTKILKSDLHTRLEAAFCKQFSDSQTGRYLDLIHLAIDDAIDTIGTSNAPYHNVEHTLYVVATGQATLLGKLQEAEISPKLWAEIILSLLYHDIGFVKGLLKKDKLNRFYTGLGNKAVTLERGKSDASLMPYHVDRGQCYISEKYQDSEFLDIEFIQSCIERTRFPIPEDETHTHTRDYPGLVRAADLIGQFSDPRYLHKLNALYQEFEEQGINRRIGYKDMQDMQEFYPIFYKNQVLPYIGEGLRLLQLTEGGQKIIESLELNLRIARESKLFLE